MDESLIDDECPKCGGGLIVYLDKNFESYEIVGDCSNCEFIGCLSVEQREWLDSTYYQARPFNKDKPYMHVESVHGSTQ